MPAAPDHVRRQLQAEVQVAQPQRPLQLSGVQLAVAVPVDGLEPLHGSRIIRVTCMLWGASNASRCFPGLAGRGLS